MRYASVHKSIGFLLATSFVLFTLTAFASQPGINRPASQSTGGTTGPSGPGKVTDQPPGTPGGSNSLPQIQTTIQRQTGGDDPNPLFGDGSVMPQSVEKGQNKKPKGEQQEYYQVKLEDVLVTGRQSPEGEGSQPTSSAGNVLSLPDTVTGGSPVSPKTGGLQEASDYLHPGEAQGFNPQPEPPGMPSISGYRVKSTGSGTPTPGGLNQGPSPHMSPVQSDLQQKHIGTPKYNDMVVSPSGSPATNAIVGPNSLVGPNSTPNAVIRNPGMLSPQTMPGVHGAISPNKPSTPTNTFNKANTTQSNITKKMHDTQSSIIQNMK